MFDAGKVIIVCKTAGRGEVLRFLLLGLIFLLSACGEPSVKSLSERIKDGLRADGINTSQLFEVKKENFWLLVEKRIADRARYVENLNLPPQQKEEYLNTILSSSIYSASVVKVGSSGAISLSVSVQDLSHRGALPLVAKSLFGRTAFVFVRNQILTGQHVLTPGSPSNPYFLTAFQGKPFLCRIYRFKLNCSYIPGFTDNVKKQHLSDVVVDLRD